MSKPRKRLSNKRKAVMSIGLSKITLLAGDSCKLDSNTVEDYIIQKMKPNKQTGLHYSFQNALCYVFRDISNHNTAIYMPAIKASLGLMVSNGWKC